MPSVEYDKFISLQGLELCHYVESLLADPETTISEDALRQMLTELPQYDEYHLVYALEFGARHLPSQFIPQVPAYLAHDSGAVLCAACNILNRLPKRDVTPELVDSVRRVVAIHPVKNFVKDMLRRLENLLEAT